MNDLNRELDQRLRLLPEPQAPATLLPRVLTAVGRVEPTRWYARPWVTWPRTLQVASATCVLLVIATVLFGPNVLAWVLPRLPAEFGRALDPLQSAGRAIGHASTLTRVFWQVWLQPIAVFVVAFLVVLSLAVTAALSLVNRFTPEQV